MSKIRCIEIPWKEGVHQLDEYEVIRPFAAEYRNGSLKLFVQHDGTNKVIFNYVHLVKTGGHVPPRSKYIQSIRLMDNYLVHIFFSYVESTVKEET